MRSLRADVQGFAHRVVAGGVQAEERRCAVTVNALAHLRNALARGVGAADLDQHDLVVVGALVLRGRKPSETFVADLGGGAFAHISDEYGGEERLFVGNNVQH